jgi:TRAP-type C4-dicarboxylate transport system permease small subunit
MGRLQKILKKVDWFLAGGMKTIIIVVTVMATTTMFLQVITRYVFEISISGLDELTGHTAVWLYLMGAAYGTYDRSHIKADMMHLFIKNQRILNGIRALSTAVAVVISSYMTVWSYGYVKWSILKHEVTPTLQIPTVWFQISILVGAALMVIYFFVEFLDLAYQVYRPRQTSKIG